MSEEALQIAEKRSERQRRKGNIYPSECRVPKNSKEREKAFLSDQCKKVEENNRMGKTRDVFKKTTDIKGTLRIPTARRSNQSILKEISPENSLEGLMVKLKLQYLAI